MQLNTIVQGAPTDRPPLLIVHGLFGSARNWQAISKRLGRTRQVIAVDMRNHGDSPWSDVNDYPAMAGDLAETLAEYGGRADVLGHSMGGKAAMVLALTEPKRVGRLIVADMAPAVYRHSQLPYVHAMQAVDLATVGRRSDADGTLAATVPEESLRAFFLQSLAVGPGGARWKLNLPVLEAEMPAIMGFPELEGRFTGPTLFVTGARSDYVGPEDWPRIRALFPNAGHVAIPDAGHWLHADAPAHFIEAVAGFLDASG